MRGSFWGGFWLQHVPVPDRSWDWVNVLTLFGFGALPSHLRLESLTGNRNRAEVAHTLLRRWGRGGPAGSAGVGSRNWSEGTTHPGWLQFSPTPKLSRTPGTLARTGAPRSEPSRCDLEPQGFPVSLHPKAPLLESVGRVPPPWRRKPPSGRRRTETCEAGRCGWLQSPYISRHSIYWVSYIDL